jgi:Fur family ferric uptake transcriptional regulator
MSPQNKFRMTHQRRVILETVKSADPHATVDDIYQTVRESLPRISLGTIYRNLDILAEQGLIRKVGRPSPQMRFESNMGPHHHVRCLVCDRIEDVHLGDLSCLDHAVTNGAGFEINGYDLEFYGLCPKCKESKRQSGINE